MSEIMEMVQALFGGGGKGTTFPADPVTHYPSHDDADFARKYDYSYGQPYAPYFTGDKATLLSSSPNKTPMDTVDVSGRNFKNLGIGNDDYYTRAALATNNSALAGLGFDPSHTAADFIRDPKMVNILGTYAPKTDQIYANARDPSTIVHESIHRGMRKLEDSPQWKPEFGDITHNAALNEAAVRHLMMNKMGNPEAENLGSVGKHQQDFAEAMFDGYSRYQKLLDAMENAASNHIANKHPMGPR